MAANTTLKVTLHSSREIRIFQLWAFYRQKCVEKCCAHVLKNARLMSLFWLYQTSHTVFEYKILV